MRFSLGNFNTIDKLKNLVQNLSVGLSRLTLGDNLEGFITEVTIPATSVAQIRNEVNWIPDYRVILKQSGQADISDSTTEWTKDYVYMENHSGSEVTLKIFFTR